jgi:diaminopimelate epimerase
MPLNFVKMHGIGNDYVYLDAVSDPALAERRDLASLSRAMSDRHTGIGADGLILVCKPSPLPAHPAHATHAHVRMRMFNADGSESEMCGNGVRCVAKFAHDRLGITANPMHVETGAGVLSITCETVDGKVAKATVDMGEPIIDLASIPVNAALLDRTPSGECTPSTAEPHAPTDAPTHARAHAQAVASIEHTLAVGNKRYAASFVSMGNPHAVIFVDDVSAIDLARVGPLLETHPAFPSRMNVHFVEVHSRSVATMRTWERGSGITRACGTGACAVCVAGVRTGRLDRSVLLHLPGGDLTIHWDQTNHVFMTGPAADSFEGVWGGQATSPHRDHG